MPCSRKLAISCGSRLIRRLWSGESSKACSRALTPWSTCSIRLSAPLIGARGADCLQAYTYDKIGDDPAVGGNANTRGKSWDNVTGGFVGITDKF